MILKQLIVKNFRNYSHTELLLNSNINIFFGNNAQGKTNLLESIYFLKDIPLENSQEDVSRTFLLLNIDIIRRKEGANGGLKNESICRYIVNVTR